MIQTYSWSIAHENVNCITKCDYGLFSSQEAPQANCFITGIPVCHILFLFITFCKKVWSNFCSGHVVGFFCWLPVDIIFPLIMILLDKKPAWTQVCKLVMCEKQRTAFSGEYLNSIQNCIFIQYVYICEVWWRINVEECAILFCWIKKCVERLFFL